MPNISLPKQLIVDSSCPLVRSPCFYSPNSGKRPWCTFFIVQRGCLGSFGKFDSVVLTKFAGICAGILGYRVASWFIARQKVQNAESLIFVVGNGGDNLQWCTCWLLILCHNGCQNGWCLRRCLQDQRHRQRPIFSIFRRGRLCTHSLVVFFPSQQCFLDCMY